MSLEKIENISASVLPLSEAIKTNASHRKIVTLYEAKPESTSKTTISIPAGPFMLTIDIFGSGGGGGGCASSSGLAAMGGGGGGGGSIITGIAVELNPSLATQVIYSAGLGGQGGDGSTGGSKGLPGANGVATYLYSVTQTGSSQNLLSIYYPTVPLIAEGGGGGSGGVAVYFGNELSVGGGGAIPNVSNATNGEGKNGSTGGAGGTADTIYTKGASGGNGGSIGFPDNFPTSGTPAILVIPAIGAQTNFLPGGGGGSGGGEVQNSQYSAQSGASVSLPTAETLPSSNPGTGGNVGTLSSGGGGGGASYGTGGNGISATQTSFNSAGTQGGGGGGSGANSNNSPLPIGGDGGSGGILIQQTFPIIF